MIPLWLAALIVAAGIISTFLIIMMICYGFILLLKLKDKIGGKKDE